MDRHSWIRIEAGADLRFLSGAELRLWAYYPSHDQIFFRIRLGETYGTLHMGGCMTFKMSKGCQLYAPLVTDVTDNPFNYIRFTDEAIGLEIVCKGISLDPKNPPDTKIECGLVPSFRLLVTTVEYNNFGETVLTGVLESGQISGGDPICIPTASGASFHSVVASMEGPGPYPPPSCAEKIGKATLIVGVEGTPPKKDVVVPCIAEG